MDRETRQWIVDRVVWVVGLAFSVLVAAKAFAGEPDRHAANGDTLIAASGPAIRVAGATPMEAR